MDTKIANSDQSAPRSHHEPLSPALISDLLRLIDLVVIGVTGFAIYFFYVYQNQSNQSLQYAATIMIGVLACGLVFQRLGVYAGDFVFMRFLRAERMLVACALAFALLLVTAFALKITSYYSRVWVVSWFVGSAGLLSLIRLVFGQWIRHMAQSGSFANRTVIVGVGAQGQRLAAYLQQKADVRIRVLGFIDDQATPEDAAKNSGDILGNMDDLIQLVRQNEVDQVLIALPWEEEDRVQNLVHHLAMTPVRIRLAPDLAAYQFLDRRYARVARLPMLDILSRPLSGWSHVYKNAEDRVLAVVFLTIFALPMALIALAIKLDSSGPVLFRQKRQGFNDNPIEVWKFRSMQDHQADVNGLVQATKEDPRVTRVGRFLRRTSLDELPQLFNVLRGEMSIVGPRPHEPTTKAKGHLFEEIVDQYAARHRVKPGITGWAQVNGWRGETDTLDKIQKRVEHDLYYIDNWSIWLDLMILGKTLVVVLKGDKAY